MIGVVSIPQPSGSGQSFLLILNDMDSPEGYHTPIEGGVFLWLHIIPLYNRERSLVTLPDGIHLMASQSTVEIQLPLVEDIADRHCVRIVIVTQ